MTPSPQRVKAHRSDGRAVGRRDILVGGAALAALGGGAAYVVTRQMGSPDEYEEAVRVMRSRLAAQPETQDLIRYATLAPNGHNTQPWRFDLSRRHITIRPDFSRRTPVVDPDDHHLFVSLGCAAETLALAASARGRGGELSYDPSGDGKIGFAYGPSTPVDTALFDAIPRRQSTRAEYDGRAVSSADLRSLASAGSIPGVDLELITDAPRRDRLRDLVVAGNDVQMRDPAFIRELKSWLRFDPRQALDTGDGLYAPTNGSPALPRWLGPRAFDILVTAKSENDRYARQMRSSGGIAVFVGAQADREHWVLAGRACQRFALQATALGLKCAFVNQPVEVEALRADLAALVGLPGRRPDIVMRFGHGPETPYSARRPVAMVLAT